jgi:hypothetical protein
LAVLAGLAVTLARRVRARRVRSARLEHRLRAAALRAALAALVALAAMQELAAPVALGQPGLAPVVDLVLRAPAALAASVAWVVPDGMRAVSAMAPLVVMRAPVALVAWAELRARRARTLRP